MSLLLLLRALAAVDASSATTDGADVLAASADVVVGASSSTTDGADVLAARADVVVSASSATTDGADVLSALADPQVGPAVGASADLQEGTDLLAAQVDVAPAAGGSYGGKKRRYAQRIGDRLVVFNDPALAIPLEDAPAPAAIAKKRATRVAEWKENEPQGPAPFSSAWRHDGGESFPPFESNGYRQVMSAVRQQLLQQQERQQDEDEVEMLLMSL